MSTQIPGLHPNNTPLTHTAIPSTYSKINMIKSALSRRAVIVLMALSPLVVSSCGSDKDIPVQPELTVEQKIQNAQEEFAREQAKALDSMMIKQTQVGNTRDSALYSLISNINARNNQSAIKQDRVLANIRKGVNGLAEEFSTILESEIDSIEQRMNQRMDINQDNNNKLFGFQQAAIDSLRSLIQAIASGQDRSTSQNAQYDRPPTRPQQTSNGNASTSRGDATQKRPNDYSEPGSADQYAQENSRLQNEVAFWQGQVAILQEESADIISRNQSAQDSLLSVGVLIEKLKESISQNNNDEDGDLLNQIETLETLSEYLKEYADKLREETKRKQEELDKATKALDEATGTQTTDDEKKGGLFRRRN